MNVDLEDIRAMVQRQPGIRGKTILAKLQEKQKTQELLDAQYRHLTGESKLQQAVKDWEPKRETTFWSAFNRMMGRDV